LSGVSWRTSTTWDEAIESLSERIGEVISPFAEKVALLDTIPGVDKRTAELLIAEIGADMSVFPTHRHLASWAGLCPAKTSPPARNAPARRARDLNGCAPD
jgi:transposase